MISHESVIVRCKKKTSRETKALRPRIQKSINLVHEKARCLHMSPLDWDNWGDPAKLKITNTGYTAVITGHWKHCRPSVSGGPFKVPFNLAQIHFHWGPDDHLGSEHTLNGRSFPLEMHVMLYDSSFSRPRLAQKENNGTAVIVYFFEVKDNENESLYPIVDRLADIQASFKSAYLNPQAIQLASEFNDGYFFYWGSIITDSCSHVLPWIINPKPLDISSQQLAEFRKLLNPEKRRITRNGCAVEPVQGHQICYAMMADSNPSFNSSSNEQKSATSQRSKKGKVCGEKLEEIMFWLNNLEKETSRKLKQLEALSKELVTNDITEGHEWYKKMERRIQVLEAKSMLLKCEGRITTEDFEKWKLKNLLFKEIQSERLTKGFRREHKERKRHRKKGKDKKPLLYCKSPRNDNVVYSYRNPAFRDSTSFSDNPKITMNESYQEQGILESNKTESSSIFMTPSPELKESSKVGDFECLSTATKSFGKTTNFIERNKKLAKTFYNKRAAVKGKGDVMA